MRKLHLVGLTTDRNGLIFTARKGSKSGGFIVPLDEKLLAAIVQASDGPNGAPLEAVAEATVVHRRLRSESALTPREMQARLRAGRSIEEVAAEAGVDNEWVARFAVPILAEQAQVVELARAVVYAKPRLGESTQPLGASVLQNLSDRGVFLPDDVANAAWSAFQLHDSVWMVRFRYRSRSRDQEAQWEIDVPTGRLRARNRHASDLGYVDPERWRATEEPDEVPGEAEAPVAPARRATRAKPETRAEAVAIPKRRTAARPPAPRTATTRSAPAPAPTRTAGKTAKAGKAVKTAKAAKAVKGARTAAAKAPAAEKSARTAPVRRRPAKADPAPDGGPAAGSGSVRMAVAQVSTARVAASMAAAEREPWAAAVRRPVRVNASNAASAPMPLPVARRRPPVAPEPVRQARRGETAQGRAFEPRPLPPPGQEPKVARVRKVPAPRARSVEESTGAVSLPAPRIPAPRQEPMPAERPKRRRLRSR